MSDIAVVESYVIKSKEDKKGAQTLLTFPGLKELHMTFMNSLVNRPRQYELTLLNHQCTFDTNTASPITSSHKESYCSACITLSVNNKTCKVFLVSEAIKLLFEPLSTSVDLVKTPIEIIKALIYLTLGDCIRDLASHGLTIEIIDLYFQGRNTLQSRQTEMSFSIPMTMQLNPNCDKSKEHSFPMFFRCEDALIPILEPLVRAQDTPPMRNRWHNTEALLRLSVCFKPVSLGLADVRALEEQDIVLLPIEDNKSEIAVNLLYRNYCLFSGIVIEQQLQITNKREFKMEEITNLLHASNRAKEQIQPTSNEPLASLDDLPVDIHFQLDSQTISFSDLEALNINSTMLLNCSANEPVTLLANGCAFAKAELLTVNDHIAARITKILIKA